ncbi:unnamed protein product [Prunus armeniaca]
MKIKPYQSYISMFLLIFLVCLMSQTLVTDSLFDKLRVHVVNSFQNETLEVHGKSKDDDLGLHHIPVNQEFNWHFWIAILKKTLFFCDTWWRGGKASFHAFSAEEGFLKFCGDGNCMWRANEDGMSLLDYHHQQYHLMHRWESS